MDAFGGLSRESRITRPPAKDIEDLKEYGRERIARVANNIELLTAYANAQPDEQDLHDWLEAWQVAQAQNAHTDPELKEGPLAALAESLAGYVMVAEEWKKEQVREAK